MKNTGKVALLEKKIDECAEELNFDGVHTVHVGIAHTRSKSYPNLILLAYAEAKSKEKKAECSEDMSATGA